MNKKMSRFISALLVVAMVCAMVPAVFAAVTGVSISGAPSGEVEIGYTTPLTATVIGDEGTDQTVTWSSSAPTTVSVSNGEIKALAAGTATITATSTADHTKSATCEIKVKSTVPVTGVTLVPPSLTLTVGGTETLTATVAPGNATNKNVTWSSDKDTVATVSNGTVTAVGVGNATITVTTEDGSKTATCNVTVSKANVSIDPTLVFTKTVAVGTDISAIGLPATGEITVSGSTKVIYNILWSPDGYNKNKAGTYTLKGTPSLKAEDAGNYNLTTTEVTAEITVVEGPTIQVTALSSEMLVKKGATGKTLSVTATATAGDGTTNLTSNLKYQWKVSDTVNGTFVNVANGASPVFAIPTDTIGVKYYACELTVKDPKTDTEAKRMTNAIKVEVCGAYRVRLATDGDTNKPITVGTKPTITATVEQFNEKNNSFEPALSYNKLTWKLATSGDQYKFATLTPDSTNRRAVLNTFGVESTNAATKMTVKVVLTEEYYSEISFDVKAGSAQKITVPSVGGGATFTASAFMNAVKAATTNTEFDYVMFTAPSNGTLYESISSKTKITTGDKCFYNPGKNDYALDGIYFVPAANAKEPSVSYVAYNPSGGVVAAGTVVISGSAGDIVYETSSNQSVKFDEADFQKFFATVFKRGTLSYVNFDVKYDNNLNTRTHGYLYESSDRNADYVRENRDYVYDVTSRQCDLDTIVFTAGTRTSKYTVTIPFTAYGTEYNSTKAVYVNGYVTISVNDGKATTIYSVGTSFKGDLYKAMIPDNYTEREVKGFYVEFGTVTGGKLYYDYKTIASAKEVSSKTVFFFDAGRNELDLSDVYFVPEAGATTAKVTYTIYNNKTKVDTGSLTFTVIQQTKSNYFSDVTESNTGKWSANSIDFMSANELVTGTAAKTFSPNQTMTRAMLVTILYRVADKPSVKNVSNPFTDVKAGTYYYDAVLWAYKNNIVTGTSNTTFNPNGAVTREQIAAILYRYAGSPRVNASLKGYSDQNKVSTYATTAMEWAVKNGIITGKSATTLDPTGKGTRAEVAVMLHRYLTK